jgi:hypothetical protein
MPRPERKPETGPPGARDFVDSLRSCISLEERYQRHLLLILLALALTLIIVPKGGFIPDYYAPGDVAVRDVKAPRDLLIPDQSLSEQKRLEAEEAVLALYDYDPRTGAELADRLLQVLTLAHDGAARGTPAEELRHKTEESFGISLSGEELAVLGALPATAELREQLRTAVTGSMAGKVVGNLKLFQADLKKGVAVRNLVTRSETARPGQEAVHGVGEAQEAVAAALHNLRLSKPQRAVVAAVVQRMLRPNLTFNKNETESRKSQAREAVQPVLIQVKKGEMVVREGERVSEEQIAKLKTLRELGRGYSTLRTAAGLFLAILLLLFTCHRFARRNIRKYRPDSRDLLFLATTFVGLFALVKLLIFVSTALESAFPYIDSASYYYLFPFAVGTMLVRIVLNSEVALVFAVLCSLLLGVLFGNNLVIAFYALAGSLTGAHWVRQCKERSTLYRAGARLALVNALLVLGLQLVAGRPLDGQFLFKLGFALAGGLLCAMIVNGTIPLAEALFKYTTDIKLLELANLNNPALRELMIQAPGTYHHSVIVGNLVEAAAEMINANPLLARVAAYYHDIGKIRKPLYFIENLGIEENRHDKLAPSMSALILIAHVKDGVELAREHRLGTSLVEIIRQHHGTALIKFFYDKARSKADPDVQQVDERDYRYPGPKPQTREAALIMLADAVEAASRTLTDPTPARIQGMVQKIINNIFIDGQLDECELTLKDLHNIAKSFNRILAGIFHQRIDYPEPAYKEREKEPAKRKNGEDTHRESARAAKDKEAAPAKSGAEDIKRLGMS